MGTADQGYAPATGPAADVATLLRRVADLVGNARQMPLSTSVMINRDEVLELVEEAVNRLPEELRAARWLLRERQEFLTKVQREGDEILEAARVRAERMVQRTEVVRAAEAAARRTVEEAEVQSRRLRHQAEDFCDQKLAQFEIVLDRTVKTVQAGRARLQVALPEDDENEEQLLDEADEGADGDFYDQDSG
ncbi:MAG: hypothetical protein M3N11_00040 [Actinomycetota bacterium]|nr:hypothetical protein [Actinomycetota bacterium]